MEPITQEKLKQLGLTGAAKKLKELKESRRKMMIAYEYYRFVRPEHFQVLQAKLWREGKELHYQKLSQYERVPPAEVLVKLEEAINHQCFDSFEVVSVRAVKDPILFGKIKGCKDKFIIAQWDDDLKVSDLLKDHEG